ncbi:MAG: hypothetical protein IKB34_01090 [Clostridia bacterium]|nr:hypothetical protein [Clostridia bacterium]
MRQRISGILGKAYGIGILIALFVGGLSFLGYLAALIIGGETATAICVFIYKSAYPVLFVFSSSVALLGLVKMYVAGEKSMSPSKRRSKSAEDGKEH